MLEKGKEIGLTPTDLLPDQKLKYYRQMITESSLVPVASHVEKGLIPGYRGSFFRKKIRFEYSKHPGCE